MFARSPKRFSAGRENSHVRAGEQKRARNVRRFGDDVLAVIEKEQQRFILEVRN
jgi:hypothetical protein